MSRILVIEDSVVEAHLLQGLLEGAGFSAETAADGQQGLDLLATSPFDLVLTDVLMPGLSGFEVCRRIKSNPATKDKPVVLLTQLNDPLDILCGLECGADNFITKPYSAEFLIARLQKILGNLSRLGPAQSEPAVEVSFRGTGITFTSDKEQILDLLLATLEGFIRSKEREHEILVAKEALEQSRAVIQSTLNALSQAIGILDESGRVLATNHTWQLSTERGPWFGVGCEVGTNYFGIHETLADQSQWGKAERGIRSLLARECDRFSLEYSCNTAVGERWFELYATRFEDARPRVVVAHEDVTLRKQVEESLRQKVDELAEADRRKNEFLDMLAHELRNPLAPLRFALQVIKVAGDDREKTDGAREIMERQVGHLTRIVDDLLDVSRITRGKVQFRVERLDLARLVRLLAKDQLTAIEDAGLILNLDVPELPVWVKGDGTRLTQAISNLVQNGIKFTDRGGQITIRLIADREEQQALLTILDTGIGIEAALLPRLFVPFAQGDCSLDRSRGGLGLGLSLVKGLIELHGGEVSATSDGLGRGAKFSVRVPCEPEPPALMKVSFFQRRTGATKQNRILVIEDNHDSAASLRMLLELLGHEVAVAYTGPAGVQTAIQWQPDVVLCDIGLPGMDGFHVVQALRQDPITVHARIIAVTGYGEDEDRCRSRDAGFDQYLTKPVDPDLLEELCALGRRTADVVSGDSSGN